MARTFLHDPVMVDEVVALFGPVPAGVVVDGTAGGGGHSAALLEAHGHLGVLAQTGTPTRSPRPAPGSRATAAARWCGAPPSVGSKRRSWRLPVTPGRGRSRRRPEPWSQASCWISA